VVKAKEQENLFLIQSSDLVLSILIQGVDSTEEAGGNVRIKGS
jgi:hypothetical protein